MSKTFKKWDKAFAGKDLDAEIKEIEKNGGNRNFEDIPFGNYEVKIKRIELKEAKSSGNPMFAVRFQILNGDYKNQYIFMNQVITQGFQIHIVNEFLRSTGTGVEVEWPGNYEEYSYIIDDVMEDISELEYHLNFDENEKGYNTFEILEVF